MKIVVQNWITKQFLTEIGTWTTALAHAKPFTTTFDAYHYCEDHSVPNSQVILQFDRSRHNIPQRVNSH
jgi:hypothetical protein